MRPNNITRKPHKCYASYERESLIVAYVIFGENSKNVHCYNAHIVRKTLAVLANGGAVIWLSPDACWNAISLHTRSNKAPLA